MLGRVFLGSAAIAVACSALGRDSDARAIVSSTCADSASITWEPTVPARGALFRVRVRGVPADAQLTGTFASEALHFVVDSGRASFAAVPIESGDSLPIVVICSSGGSSDSLAATIATATGDYPVERLRVAPAFGRRPDSATAARIARESRRAAAVAENAHLTPRLWDSTFVLPRESRITSGFGGGREFNGTITSRHMGTDFAGVTGAPVRAANRGVVRIVDAFFYGGNVVYIDHGSGLSSAYLHLSQQLVAAGDTVARGQTIGRVGATGRVTGPHLHFIVRYGRVTVDPFSLFSLAGEPK
jgi:murein DD-endopeptidase MepM/ murein hydrolase activator NlpD